MRRWQSSKEMAGRATSEVSSEGSNGAEHRRGGQHGGGPGEGGMEGRRRLREEKRDGVRERGDCLVLAAAIVHAAEL